MNPPQTTDFGILFLPSEALYAEVLCTPGIIEKLQRETRVVVAGPTSLAAILNSLQMGFRTLAVQKRSSEVWKTLGAVKNQFSIFSGLLDKVSDKLQQASFRNSSVERSSWTMVRSKDWVSWSWSRRSARSWMGFSATSMSGKREMNS